MNDLFFVELAKDIQDLRYLIIVGFMGLGVDMKDVLKDLNELRMADHLKDEP